MAMRCVFVCVCGFLRFVFALVIFASYVLNVCKRSQFYVEHPPHQSNYLKENLFNALIDGHSINRCVYLSLYILYTFIQMQFHLIEMIRCAISLSLSLSCART